MNKKIMLFVFAFLLISLVSAYDLQINNIKSYDSITKTAVFKDSILGIPTTEIATAKLETPQVYTVLGLGYQKVFEITVNSKEFYNNPISQIKTYDKDKKGNLIPREQVIDLKYFDGKYWKDLPKEIPEGEITVAGFTDVRAGDYVEWIPTMFGVEVSEWAVYATDPFLKSYWKFDEASGGTAYDSVSGNNLTVGTGVTWNSTGKINYDLNYSGTGGTAMSFLPFTGTQNFSLFGWVKTSDNGNVQGIISFGSTATLNQGLQLYKGADNVLHFDLKNIAGPTGSGAINNNAWRFVGVVWNGTHIQMYLDGVVNGTPTSMSPNIQAGSQFIGALTTGTSYWRGGIDEWGIWNRTLNQAEISQLYNSGNGLQFPFLVVTQVNLTNPPNGTGYTTLNGVTFNASASISNMGTVVNATRYLYYSNGTLISTNYTTYVPNNKTNFTSNGISEGSYLWNIQMCGSDSNCIFAVNNVSFLYDQTPPILNITYPRNAVNYFIAGNNISLNYTLVETNPSICQYNYNSTTANITISCSTNTTFQISEHRDRNVSLFANDSANNMASSTANWSYYVFQYSTGISTPVQSGITQTFTYNFSSQYTPSTVRLYYNGSANSATVTNPDTDMWLGTVTMTIPSTNSSQTKNLYWSVTFTDGTVVNSTVSNQVISPIIFAICSTSVNTTVLNISARDEVTNTLLNYTLSASFDYWNGNGSSSDSLNYSFSNLTDNYYYAFCVTPASVYINSTATVSYSRTGYGTRSYYFTNTQFSNVTQNLTLYLLNSSATGLQTVNFVVVDQSGNGVGGAYINIQKWDLGTNTYNTVNVVQTDTDGRTAADLQVNVAWYRYLVSYNGILYLSTTPLVETQTSRVLTISLTAGTPYNNFNSVYGDVAFNNNTNTFTFTFTDTSGTVGSGCLEVNKLSAASLTTVAYYCINASSGTAIYTATENGTYVANGIAILTNAYGSVQQTLDSLSVTIGRSNASATVGTFGFIIFLILFVTMGAFGASSNSLILSSVLGVGAVIFAGWIGWISYSGMALPVSLAIIFIFIGIIAYRKYF